MVKKNGLLKELRKEKDLMKGSLAQTQRVLLPKRLSFSCRPEARGGSSQAFWNHMDRLDQKTLIKIENDLLLRLIDQFKIDLNCLLYDATNFYTYINTKTKSELAQRGHNKQKRTDLRLT